MPCTEKSGDGGGREEGGHDRTVGFRRGRPQTHQKEKRIENRQGDMKGPESRRANRMKAKRKQMTERSRRDEKEEESSRGDKQ